MPLFVPAPSVPQDLTVTLSQVLFPILVMLGATGMVVGILNSYDRFGAFAISPFFWNVAIIAVLVALAPRVRRRRPDLRLRDRRPGRHRDPARDPRLGPAPHAVSAAAGVRLAKPRGRRVLLLMLPVTLSLGLINFNLLINSIFGSLVSERAPAAIDKAFRIYMLPAGDLLGRGDDGAVPDPGAARRAPRLRRPAGDDGQRDAADRAAADPRRRRDPGALGADDPARLPAGGVRRRRTPSWSPRRSSGSPSRCRSTASSCCSRAPSSASSAPGCRPRSRASTWRSRRSPPWRSTSPFGVGGIVAATVIATAVSVLAQTIVLRRQLGGSSSGRLTWTTLRVARRRRRRSRGSSYGGLVRARPGAGPRRWPPRSSRSAPASRLARRSTPRRSPLLRIPEAQQIWRLVCRRGRG